MKMISLLIILQIAVFTGFAQNHKPVDLRIAAPVNLATDTQQYNGYTMRLMRGMHAPQRMGSYSFNILKDNSPVAHEVRNPLLFSPREIQKKEDAYKIAQWMIDEYERTGHWRNIMPPHVARELKIETH